MATTARKAAAPRVPQDRKAKAPTAAERLAAEATGEALTVEVGGRTFAVKDPLDWSATAMETLAAGSWMAWASSALDEGEDFQAFGAALSGASNRALNGQRLALLRTASTAMGEGLGS